MYKIYITERDGNDFSRDALHPRNIYDFFFVPLYMYVQVHILTNRAIFQLLVTNTCFISFVNISSTYGAGVPRLILILSPLPALV